MLSASARQPSRYSARAPGRRQTWIPCGRSPPGSKLSRIREAAAVTTVYGRANQSLSESAWDLTNPARWLAGDPGAPDRLLDPRAARPEQSPVPAPSRDKG